MRTPAAHERAHRSRSTVAALVVAAAASLFALLMPTAAAAVEPGEGSETGNLYADPETFDAGQEIRLTANFPSSDEDRTVTFYRRIGSGSWDKIGTDAANKYGNAYLAYGPDQAQQIFARTSRGDETEVQSLAPTGVEPGEGSETGNLYADPETFVVGQELRLTANFPSSDEDRTVTFYRRIGTGPWDKIGTDTANRYGNAYLPYNADQTQQVFARTSRGDETEVKTFQTDGSEQIEGTLTLTPDEVAAGDPIEIAANFAVDRAGLLVTFYARAGASGAFDSIGTDEANANGNAYLRDFRVDETLEIYAATSKGRTASATVTVAARPESEPLTVASYNVRCANCEHHSSEARSWYDRRSSVVSAILEQEPDVIGIQEASQGWLRRNDGAGEKFSLAQFEDLRTRLRDGGTPYEITNSHRNNCVKSTTPSGCSYKDQGASKGTRIFYNEDEIELIRQGSERLAGCSGCNERYVAWAELEQKSTGDRFFFSTTHLEPYEQNYSLRNRQAREMMAEVELRNSGDLPAFVVGDLNSTNFREPDNAPFDIVVDEGFVDPLGHVYGSPEVGPDATAELRVRANFSSFNNFLRYVPRFDADENGSNLDYIFTTPMRTTWWETVVDLDSGGRLRGIIPSDHNMLVARVLLPS